jgi:hypothetical protein
MYMYNDLMLLPYKGTHLVSTLNPYYPEGCWNEGIYIFHYHYGKDHGISFYLLPSTEEETSLMPTFTTI